MKNRTSKPVIPDFDIFSHVILTVFDRILSCYHVKCEELIAFLSTEIVLSTSLRDTAMELKKKKHSNFRGKKTFYRNQHKKI